MDSISNLAGFDEETSEGDSPKDVNASVPATPEPTISSKPTREDVSPATTETTSSPTATPRSEFLDLLVNKIAPVGTLEARPPLKMMIYSDPGAGKTTLMGQVPNNLIIDTEKGSLTLQENKKHRPELVADGVAVLPYKSFEGLEMAIHEFANEPEQLAHIETITIDTVNNLHKRGLADVTEREWQRNPMSNRYSPETEHHTENNEHIRRLIQSLVDLDRNIMLIAHSRTIEPKGKPAKTFPDFSEKLANTLAGMVDVVGYMYKTELDGEETRVMRFQPTLGIIAKSRIASLPDNMVEPTWDKIWEAYNS